MTREDAKKFHIVGVIDRMRYEKFVDYIFDDIESRVCENCEHLSTFGFCVNYKAIGYGKNIFEDFYKGDVGCNKFERKP